MNISIKKLNFSKGTIAKLMKIGCLTVFDLALLTDVEVEKIVEDKAERERIMRLTQAFRILKRAGLGSIYSFGSITEAQFLKLLMKMDPSVREEVAKLILSAMKRAGVEFLLPVREREVHHHKHDDELDL